MPSSACAERDATVEIIPDDGDPADSLRLPGEMCRDGMPRTARGWSMRRHARSG